MARSRALLEILVVDLASSGGGHEHGAYPKLILEIRPHFWPYAFSASGSTRKSPTQRSWPRRRVETHILWRPDPHGRFQRPIPGFPRSNGRFREEDDRTVVVDGAQIRGECGGEGAADPVSVKILVRAKKTVAVKIRFPLNQNRVIGEAHPRRGDDETTREQALDHKITMHEFSPVRDVEGEIELLSKILIPSSKI